MCDVKYRLFQKCIRTSLFKVLYFRSHNYLWNKHVTWKLKTWTFCFHFELEIKFRLKCLAMPLSSLCSFIQIKILLRRNKGHFFKIRVNLIWIEGNVWRKICRIRKKCVIDLCSLQIPYQVLRSNWVCILQWINARNLEFTIQVQLQNWTYYTPQITWLLCYQTLTFDALNFAFESTFFRIITNQMAMIFARMVKNLEEVM